jgi:hypothetical protein
MSESREYMSKIPEMAAGYILKKDGRNKNIPAIS